MTMTISAAWAVLKDPVRRRAYNRSYPTVRDRLLEYIQELQEEKDDEHGASTESALVKGVLIRVLVRLKEIVKVE